MTGHPIYLFRELATNIPDETLNVDVEAVFEFEAQIAKVSANIVVRIHGGSVKKIIFPIPDPIIYLILFFHQKYTVDDF